MRVMALDHGAARTGVAVSDATGTLATPADGRRARSTATPASRGSSRWSRSRRPRRIVVGLPVSLDGREHAQAARARAFARRLAAAIAVPVATYDERFTTKVATQRGGRAPVDARGAAVILEDYLRAREARAEARDARAPTKRARRPTRSATMPDDSGDLPPDDPRGLPPDDRGRRASRRAARRLGADRAGSASEPSQPRRYQSDGGAAAAAAAAGGGADGADARRRRRRARRRLVVLIVLVVLSPSSSASAWAPSAPTSPPGEVGAKVKVTIPEGSSLKQIAAILAEKGVVEHANLFVYQVKDDGYEDDLKPGTYLLRVNEPYDESRRACCSRAWRRRPSTSRCPRA